MRPLSTFTKTILLGFCLIGFSGCGGEAATETNAEGHSDHDHDDAGHDDHDHGDHAGHDHGDHATQIDASAAGLSTDDLVSLDEPPIPDNFSDAVAELATLSKTIAASIKSGDIKDDHGPLHNVGGLLDGIGALAKKSSMKDDVKKEVGAAVESLLDDFGDVDYRLHDAEKGKDYDDVADSIGAAIKTLQSHAK